MIVDRDSVYGGSGGQSPGVNGSFGVDRDRIVR